MRRLSAIFAFILLLPGLCRAEGDDFCTWTALRVSAKPGERWTVGAMAEYRTKQEEFSQFYLRPFVSYNIGAGFQVAYQNDFAFKKSGFNFRMLPQLSYSCKWGNMAFMLRQRLMATYKPDKGWSEVFRTKAMLDYKIGSGVFTPTIAVEPFYWDKMSRTRYYAGIKMRVSKQSSLSLQYVRQDYAGNHPDQDVIWFLYSIRL